MRELGIVNVDSTLSGGPIRVMHINDLAIDVTVERVAEIAELIRRVHP